MLERIAAALEIDAPVLFSLKSYPASESGTIVKFREQVLNDIAQVIAYCVKERKILVLTFSTITAIIMIIIP